MKKYTSLQWLTTAVLTYMVLAFAWWAIALWRENDRIFSLSLQALEMKYNRQAQGINLTALRHTAEYRALEARHRKHRRMILSEGIFFTLCLGFGLWVINRAAWRELDLARQRRNFMLSITHELKSPIAAMRLALETLQRRELQREQVEKLCAHGVRNAARLQSLVDDLLLAARLESDWQPQIERVYVREVIDACIANTHMRFPSACITVDIPPDFPPIQADAQGFTSVVQNLLDNALKYSELGSTVHISVGPAVGYQMYLRVADQGIGIPDAEKGAIFEKFYRVGNEEVRRSAGAGLGLYIVKQVVHLHKGTITVSDNVPKGTVFTVML